MGCLTDQLKAYEKALKQNCGGNAKKPRSEPELVLAKIAALQKSLEHFDLSRAQQGDTADIHDRLLSGVIKIPSTLAKVPGIAPKALFLEASRLILDLAEQSEDEASLRLYSQMVNNVVRSMHEICRRKIKLNFWQKVFRWI